MSADSIEAGDQSGIREVPTSSARSEMPELIEYVRDGGFVYFTRYGRRVAALVPADVAENYERIEDDYWARRAADARSDKGEPVPWDEAVAELEGQPGRSPVQHR